MYHTRVLAGSPDREWVVFIHGFGGSSDTWKRQEEEYLKKYNLLLLDMHGNGHAVGGKLTVKGVCRCIAETMDYHHITRAHFVSISIGTMIALAFAAEYGDRVLSLVMAGGILRFNLRTNILLLAARLLKNVIPYMWLYSFFAFIILPRKNHRKSREIFVREAKKLGTLEFRRWVEFIPHIRKSGLAIKTLNAGKMPVPILYIMGSEDHLFVSDTIRHAARIRQAAVCIIPGCGHVCSIEKHNEFTEISLGFIRRADIIFH